LKSSSQDGKRVMGSSSGQALLVQGPHELVDFPGIKIL
jgi:hypothetical protein